MVNGEGTGDVPGSEEHSNALDVPSSSSNSLTEAMPDPTVAQVGAGIAADLTDVGDGEAPAQLNLIVGGLAAVAAPAPAQPYFDIEAGLFGPPLRRSQVGPFF